MIFRKKWVTMEEIAADVKALLHEIQRSKEVQKFASQ